ncbi:MAG: hypothetical protein U9R40_05135, partial [Synergistota bacterium]|nr:hypothetical protein [Synergistota bacterium]
EAGVSFSVWRTSGVGILMDRTSIHDILGQPDGIEETREWYAVTESKGMTKATIDYIGTDTAHAVSLEFAQESLTMDELASTAERAFPDAQLMHRDELVAMYLARQAGAEKPVYILVIAENPQKERGPQIVTMTEEANQYYKQ